MATTYAVLHVHLVFSTKGRHPWIVPAIEARVWAYLGAIARENRIHPIQIGGMEDHVHTLVGLPPVLAVARAAQLLKGGSSRWMRATFRTLPAFGWQDGYGAFSVSHSKLQAVAAYIRDQRHHHCGRSFVAEYRALLTRHGVAPDERFLLG